MIEDTEITLSLFRSDLLSLGLIHAALGGGAALAAWRIRSVALVLAAIAAAASAGAKLLGFFLHWRVPSVCDGPICRHPEPYERLLSYASALDHVAALLALACLTVYLFHVARKARRPG